MPNLASSIKEGICRRSVLKSVPMIAGAIISTNALAQNLLAQAKLTHEAAKYQDHPNNGQQCSGCVQFVAPASCKVVEDPVAASGWCQLFMAKPASDSPLDRPKANRRNSLGGLGMRGEIARDLTNEIEELLTGFDLGG